MFISPVTQMIALNGVSARMVADVARPLPESLVPVALLRGVRSADGSATPPPETALSVEEVAAAIRTLMEAGDSKAFGATGEPKLAALSKQLGVKVSDELRDAAWVVVKAEG
jgi:hypothetical protein